MPNLMNHHLAQGATSSVSCSSAEKTEIVDKVISKDAKRLYLEHFDDTYLTMYRQLLEDKGYVIFAVNLNSPRFVVNLNSLESNKYNPLIHINSDIDILKVAKTISADFVKGGLLRDDPVPLLCALIGYLYHYGEIDQLNFSNVMRLIRAADSGDDDSYMESALDKMFYNVELHNPDDFTNACYQSFKLCPRYRQQMLLAGIAAYMSWFDDDSVCAMTSTCAGTDCLKDFLNAPKAALFVISDADCEAKQLLVKLLRENLTKEYKTKDVSANSSALLLPKDTLLFEAGVLEVYGTKNMFTQLNEAGADVICVDSGDRLSTVSYGEYDRYIRKSR